MLKYLNKGTLKLEFSLEKELQRHKMNLERIVKECSTCNPNPGSRACPYEHLKNLLHTLLKEPNSEKKIFDRIQAKLDCQTDLAAALQKWHDENLDSKIKSKIHQIKTEIQNFNGAKLGKIEALENLFLQAMRSTNVTAPNNETILIQDVLDCFKLIQWKLM